MLRPQGYYYIHLKVIDNGQCGEWKSPHPGLKPKKQLGHRERTGPCTYT